MYCILCVLVYVHPLPMHHHHHHHTQVDVDVIMSEGVAVYGAVSDNWPTIEPYFNETGSNAPSILPKYQQKELLDLSVRSVQVFVDDEWVGIGVGWCWGGGGG